MKTMLKKTLITLAFALGLTTFAFGDILTEQPYYWYTYDVSYGARCGSTALTTSGNSGNVNINTESPWGRALTLSSSKNPGPYGSKNWALSDNWTLHFRAKMPANLDKGVVISLGSCSSAGGFMLLTRGSDAGVYLANTTSASAINSLAISKAGLSSDYHDFTMVFTKSTLKVQLYIDGAAASEGAFTLSKQITDKNWQLFSAHGNNSAVKNGFGVYIEEMRFYQKALSASDISTLHNGACSGKVTLTEDTDWSSGVPSGKVRAAIDLNGHKLTLPNVSMSEVYNVQNSATGDAAQLCVNVASGKTSTMYSWLLYGNLALVKKGTGTLTLSGYDKLNMACAIDEGTLKLGYVGFANTQTVTIGESGTLDTNGTYDQRYGVVMKEGATLTNTGTSRDYGKTQLSNGITLDENATVYVSPKNEMSSTALSYGVYSINLNGGTIVKNNTGKWGVVNVNFTNGGKVVVEKGEFNIGRKDSKTETGGFACDENFVIELKKDSTSYIWMQGECTVPTIIGEGNIASSSHKLTVTSRFSGLIELGKPDGSSPFTASNKLMLGDGATLDLNGNTAPYAMHDNFAFGENCVIDVSERDLTIGTQVLAWNASGKPSTTFTWDETTAEKGVELVANDKGIFYGKMVVTAEWTNLLGDDDITNPENWTCYDEEELIIEGAVPSAVSNITIPDDMEITYPVGNREGSFTLGTGAKLTIDFGEGKYIEGTALLTSSAGTLDLANGTVVVPDGTYELTPDARQLRYLPTKVMVARWDFNNYDSEAPKSTNVLEATEGEAGFPCYHPGAGSTNITDGTIGEMYVTNVVGEADNYAIAIPLHYHVKLPLPKTVQRGDWTIRMRFFTPEASDGMMRSFFSRDNSKDADLFINKSNLVGGGGKIVPSGKYYGSAIAKEAWHLLTVSQRNGYGAVCVDGEQSYTWTDGSKWNFFFDKDYLYLCADDSGEDNLLFVDYIELDVEPPAHDSTAIVDGVLTRDVVLVDDQDWSDIEISSMNNKTVDLAGHSLTIASTEGTGRAWDSTTDAENPGSFVVNVAEGATYTNSVLSLAGNLKLVKEGAGTFVPSVPAQTYTGGTVVNAGIIKASEEESNGTKGNRLGANDTDITVNAGGTFDINGKGYWSNHDFVLNGGILANYGAFMNGYYKSGGNGIHDVRLESDSFIEVAYGTVFGLEDAVIELNGHTLTVSHVDTKSDYDCLYFRSTIQNGTFRFGPKVQVFPIYENIFGENLTVESYGDFRRGDNALTVKNLLDASANISAVPSSKSVLKVMGTFTPNTLYFQNATLADGATLNLSEKTEPWSPASALTSPQQAVTFAEGTITVDLSGRTPAKGDQIIKWSAVPQGVTFQWDAETVEAGIAPSADEFGLFYGGTRFTVDINNGGTFTIPPSVPDEDLDGVRLFYAGGAPVNNPIRSGRTITFDWDITDGACWWDYEFNGTLENTGADGVPVGKECIDPYYNAASNALRVGYATPWRDVSAYPEEFTAILHGKVVDQAGHVEMGFGSATGGTKINVSLACGDPSAEEVQLLIAEAKTVKKAVSMSVPNAYSADHLYAFVCKTITENETEKTKVVVYLDGVEWDSYTFDKKITLGTGFQIGSVHGGIPSGCTKANTDNKNAYLDFLRTYNVALNSATMTRYAALYPYKSANGKATRTFDATLDQTWVAAPADEPWVQTIGEESYATNCPLPNTMIEVTALEDATVTMNLDEQANYESFTAQGAGSITFKAGGTVIPTVSGLTTIGTDVTNAYDAIKFGKTIVLAGKTLTFDFTDFPLGDVWANVSYEVTGAVTLGEGATVEAMGIPTAAGRTATFGLNEFGHYALNVTVAEEKDFTMTVDAQGATTWTWNDEVISEPDWTKIATATITKAGEGAGSFIGKNGYTYTIDEGVLKFTNNVNMVTSTITVNEGGAFDMDGNETGSHYDIVLNGGTLANYGDGIAFSKRAIKSITLTDDSFVTTSNNLCFVSDAFHANTLDLGGHMLTKNGSKIFILMNTTVTNGAVVVEEGEIRVNAPDGKTNHTVFADDATLELKKGAGLYVNLSSLVLPEITGEGKVKVDTTLVVSNRLEGALAISGSGTLTLAEGAVLDLAMLEDAYTWPTQIACAETQTINLNGRTPKLGEKIVSWTAIPAGVTFQWDSETAKAGVEPKYEADGLLYGYDPESKVVDKAYWTGAASGDAMNPANWGCTNKAGYVVADGIPTNAEATVILNGPLTGDCDWTGLGAFVLAQDTLVDLNGHKLAIADFANRTTGIVVTNSVETTGDFVIDVAEEATAQNTTVAILGNVRLVKEGDGAFTSKVQQQSYTGGTLISAGTIKATNYEKFHLLGAAGTDIIVEPDGTLDLNGWYDWAGHRIVLAGGTLQNTGSSMTTTSWGGLGDVVLTADSKMKLKYHTLFNDNDATRYVDLGGYTLTADYIECTDPKAIVYVRNNTFRNGTFVMNPGIVLRPLTMTCVSGADFTLVVNGDIAPTASDYTIESVVDNSEGRVTDGTYVGTVTKCYKPVSTNFQNFVLADGATLDLTDQTEAWSTTSAITTTPHIVTFAENATNTVDLTGRTIAANDKIIAWETQPNATFVFRGCELTPVAEADGLYARQLGVAKIGDVYYPTLNAALEAAKSGDKVELIKDIETAEPAAFVINKSITLDFGTSTITKTVANDWVFQVAKDAEVTFAGTTGGIVHYPGVLNKVNPASMIQILGKLTVEGGVYESDYTVFKVDEDDAATHTAKGELVVNGGTFTIETQEGTIYTGLTYAVMNWSKATLNGGTFTGDITTLSNDGNAVSKAGETIVGDDVAGTPVYKLQVTGSTYANVPKIKGVAKANVTLVKSASIQDELELVEKDGYVTVQKKEEGPTPAPGSQAEVKPVPGEKDTYYVKPTGESKDILLGGVKSGDTLVVDGQAVDSLGVDDAAGVTVKVGIPNAETPASPYDITAACKGWDGAKFSTELDATKSVTIGEETIPVTPTAVESTEGTVSEGAVATKAIPGLTYKLMRGTELGTYETETASAQATTTTISLKDGTTKPADKAFYVIEVSK